VSHGRFIACRQCHVARGERAAGRERGVADAEIEAGLADMPTEGRRFENGDLVAFGLGVFLDDDRIGAHRQRTAGEDADGFAGLQRVIIRPARGRFTDQGECRGRGRHVRGAHGITVHRREVGGRLGEAGLRCSRQHAAGRVGDRHHLGGQGREGRDHAGMRLADG
jgi:hypothetical protein